jgi:hypothetical protein
MVNEPEDHIRELSPYQTFTEGPGGIKDFGPHPVDADDDSIEVQEEALTPAPKGDFAPAFADSGDFRPRSAPDASVTPVHPPLPARTEPAEDADSENGKDSGKSEGEPPIPTRTTPSPEPSSPGSSSTQTPPKPGANVPPAPVKPPISG